MGFGALIWGRGRRDLLRRVKPRDSMVRDRRKEQPVGNEGKRKKRAGSREERSEEERSKGEMMICSVQCPSGTETPRRRNDVPDASNYAAKEASIASPSAWSSIPRSLSPFPSSLFFLYSSILGLNSLALIFPRTTIMQTSTLVIASAGTVLTGLLGKNPRTR